MPINKTIDCTSTGCKDYMDKAAKAIGGGASFHAGSSMKMAFIKMAADIAGLAGKEREEFCRMLDSTPGFFGSGNNSACRQFYEKPANASNPLKEYTKW
jgi:hypothetical protein